MNIILSIAGSDCGGGAGIQADIKSASYHKVYASTVITALTAQNTQGVQAIEAVNTNFIKEQINSVLSDLNVDVIKIGMLGTIEVINTVKQCLENTNIPIVLDPVAISRTGHKLIDDDAINCLKTMFEKALLITPNSYEAKEFFNVETIEDILNCENYNTNILFKNMQKDSEFCVDILRTKNNELFYFKTPKVNSLNTHGTGCTFSASITSLLAKKEDLQTAIEKSKQYIYEAIKTAPNIGNGNGPVNHFL